MEQLEHKALATFNDAMGELIDACADLADTENQEGGAGSWEASIGYEQVLARFAAARAAADQIPQHG